MLPEEAVLCSHYTQLCNGILPLTQGLGQATCCKLADYGYKSFNKWKFATMHHAVFGQL